MRPISSNTPITAGYIPPAAVEATAGTSASSSSRTVAHPTLVRTVSRDLQARVLQANTDAQSTESSHLLIAITDTAPQTVNINLNQAAIKLRNLYQQKLRADQALMQPGPSTGIQHDAPLAINKAICTQTFVLEGMAAASARQQNPKAVITYASIKASIEESDHAAGPEASSGYTRLFSDHELCAGDTLENKLNHATATFTAYEEALNNPEVDDQEKQYIRLSYDVFNSSVKELVQEQSKALQNIPKGTPEHVQAQNNLDKAQKVLALVSRDEMLQNLRDKQTAGSMMRGLVGTVPAQTIGTLLSYGYFKSFADDAVTGQDGYSRNNWSQSVTERGGVTGVVAGGTHWVVAEVVNPSVTYLSELAGGRPVKAVDPKLIYPDAPKVISENGVPKELGVEEHAQAQQAVEKRRADFKQAQAAYKIGTVVGDAMGCASFAFFHASRVFMNGVYGFNAGNIHARAASSAAGNGFLAAGQVYTQLSQTHDGVPTHTLGNPSGATQITNGLKRLNLLNPANLNNLLNKVGGGTEGTIATSMIDTAVAGVSTSTLQGRLVKALGAGVEGAMTLAPFLHTVTAEAETREAQAQQAIHSSNFPRTEMALHGIVHPDSAHIPHTSRTTGSLSRMADNSYQVVRHGMQLVPQLVIDSLALLSSTIQNVPNAVTTAYDKTASALHRLREQSSYAEPLLAP